jgi:hypothetical protein
MQRKILFCSVAYYEFDESPVDDFTYDRWAHELARMMKECPDVDKSRYYYAFYDYEGSTGYYLYSRLTEEDKYLIRHSVELGLNK